MAKAKVAQSEPITDAEGRTFGPCGACCFFIEGEGRTAGQANMGFCHGASPAMGRFPVINRNELGCGEFRPRAK
jgi:hypothetical protein